MVRPLLNQNAELLAPGRWQVHERDSSATFSARGVWGVLPANGRFRSISGSATIGADGRLEGELVIAADTVDTGNGLRDRHLRSSDFLHVKRHPQIRFSARELALTESGPVIRGTLLARDSAIDLELPVKLTQESGARAAISCETALDLADLGLDSNPLGMIRGPVKVRVKAVVERYG
jgi:polyisoprenoid-binding protein YceI